MMYPQNYRQPPGGHLPPPGPLPVGQHRGQHTAYGPPSDEKAHFDIRVRPGTGPSSTMGDARTGFDRDRDGYRDGARGCRCRFLGSKSMGTAEPQPENVGKVVDSLIEYYKKADVQPRRYLIRIGTTILELEELENDEVHIQNVPLDAISFCASDNRYPRLFTFVARAESGYMCHVFYCRHVNDVDRLTQDFDNAFRNCYVERKQGGNKAVTTPASSSPASNIHDTASNIHGITSNIHGISDPALAKVVEAALHPQSRYRANVKEIVVEEQPRSLPIYNFQGQRVKTIRSRAATSGEPSSTRYIFAYEGDEDDKSTVTYIDRQRKSHRYPVAKEQFRFTSDRTSSNTREYRREYVQGQEPVQEAYSLENQSSPRESVRREFIVTETAHAQPVPASVHPAGAPASYRTEFVSEHRSHPDVHVVEADGRAYNRDFFESSARPAVIMTAEHPIPAADGPTILEGRDPGYGTRERFESIRVDESVDAEPTFYGRHAASNNRPDMLY